MIKYYIKNTIKYFIESTRFLIAHFRLNKRIVCEESRELGFYDFHDYTDSIENTPLHLYQQTCKRCGKKFYI
jgi:hypothetical protein